MKKSSSGLKGFQSLTLKHTLSNRDIRLDNVCFKVKDDIPCAVLIDLDRSSIATDLFEYKCYFGKSVMYKANSQLDWNQFGLLLYSLVNDI